MGIGIRIENLRKVYDSPPPMAARGAGFSFTPARSGNKKEKKKFEVVALDETGKPSFNALQNYGSSQAPLHFYVFDLMILKGKDVMGETLETRRGLLETKVLPLPNPVSRVKENPIPVEKILIERVLVNPKFDASLFSKPKVQVASLNK